MWKSLHQNKNQCIALEYYKKTHD